jgi:hypothetical protein
MAAMTKDGIAEKVSRDLHRLFDPILKEPIPERFTRLLAKLK